MTITDGVDYAWSHPSPAALKAAGKDFAARYLAHDASKILTHTEATALATHGLWSVVVWESTASRAAAGRAAGIADAHDAAAQAASAGMPSSRPIYFAVDFDAAPSSVDAYFQGVASVLGIGRTGAYGGYRVVKHLLDARLARWAWQTAAWSAGKWDSRAVIRQGGQTHINGVDVDLDTALAADYGQWQPGVTPTHPAATPHVDLSNLIAAAKADPKAPQGHTTHAADVRLVEAALKAEGLLAASYAGDGSFGSKTVLAYAAWQRHLGYVGADANGIPGRASLTKLGQRHGFTVTS